VILCQEGGYNAFIACGEYKKKKNTVMEASGASEVTKFLMTLR
jgi:hypothetical protein